MKNYSKKQNSQEIVLISKVLISAFLFLLFISSQAFAVSTLNDFYNALDSRTKNPTQERIDSDVYITKEYAEKGKIWGNYLYYTDPNKYNPSELQRLLKSGGVEKIRQEVATKYNTDTDSIVNNCKSIRLYPYCNIADTVTNIVHSLQNTARESVGKYCSQSECNENCSNALFAGPNLIGCSEREPVKKYCSQSECNKYCSNALFAGPNLIGCSEREPVKKYCSQSECNKYCSNALFAGPNLIGCSEREPVKKYCTPADKCDENCSNAQIGINNGGKRFVIFCEQNQSTTDRTRNNDHSKTDRTGYPFCNQSECKDNRISCRNFLYVGSVFKGCSKEYPQTNTRATLYCTPDQCSENCSNAIFGSTDSRNRILMYCKQTKLSHCSQAKCSQNCSNVKFILKNNRQQMSCEQTNKPKKSINIGTYAGIGNVGN
jgi:hypothetical protein